MRFDSLHFVGKIKSSALLGSNLALNAEPSLNLVYHRKMFSKPVSTLLVSFLVGIFVACQFISLAGAVNSVAAVLEPSASSMSIGQAAEFFDGVDFDHEEIVDPFLSMPHISLRTIVGDESKFKVCLEPSNLLGYAPVSVLSDSSIDPERNILAPPPEASNDLWLQKGVLLI